MQRLPDDEEEAEDREFLHGFDRIEQRVARRGAEERRVKYIKGGRGGEAAGQKGGAVACVQAAAACGGWGVGLHVLHEPVGIWCMAVCMALHARS
jgi:hypothetical protein